MAPEFVLETRGLTKEFRGFTAVEEWDVATLPRQT